MPGPIDGWRARKPAYRRRSYFSFAAAYLVIGIVSLAFGWYISGGILAPLGVVLLGLGIWNPAPKR